MFCIRFLCASGEYLASYPADAGVLLAYGSVQAIFDVSLAPLYDALAPEGGAVAIVSHAPLQGMFIAAVWTAILLLLKAYRPSITRSLPSAAALRPLVVAWLGSSLGLVALLVALHVPLDAEADFLLGSLSVIAGWRFLYSQGMPLP